VRLPVALASVATVFLAAYLVSLLLAFDPKLAKRYRFLPVLTALVLAIAPWAVHFGRIGLESSLSVSLLLLAIIFFLQAMRGRAFYLLLSASFASLAIYSYYSLRLVIPLLAVFLAVVFWRELWRRKAMVLLSGILFIMSMWPLLTSPYYEHSQDYRLNNNNLIRMTQVINESSQYLERYENVWYARLLYHRYVLWLRDFSVNYSSHFSLQFLFLSGDPNLRQHSGYFGQFLPVMLPLYIIGLYLFWQNRRSKLALTLLPLLLFAPIPAAMVYEVPHASRAIYLVLPLAVLIAWGLAEVHLRWRKLFVLLTLGIAMNAAFFYADYFIDYPKRSSRAWLYSYNQVAAYIKENHQQFRSIEIDERYWLPRIFVYYQLPDLLTSSRNLKEAFLNSPVNSFGLPDPFTYLLDQKDKSKASAKFLYHETEPPAGFTLTQEFPFADGQPSLKLFVQAGVSDVAAE
jgi:4-amino-4-deoxy-L-arabinose transferase-like glycosyltransferase